MMEDELGTILLYVRTMLGNTDEGEGRSCKEKGGGGGNTAHLLLRTTLALGVFFVYVAPVADSHSFGFLIVFSSPLWTD